MLFVCSGEFFDLAEVKLHRRITAEDGHENGELLGGGLDVGDDGGHGGEGAIGDGDLIADGVGDLKLALLGGGGLVAGLLEGFGGDHGGHHGDDFLAAERCRILGGADEAGDAFGFADDATGFLIGPHTNQDVAGDAHAGEDLLALFGVLFDFLHGDFDLEDLVFETEALDAGFDVGLDALLVTGIGVEHVPLAFESAKGLGEFVDCGLTGVDGFGGFVAVLFGIIGVFGGIGFGFSLSFGILGFDGLIGLFSLIFGLFDGFDRKDFSLSATYLGTLTDEKGDVYAAAEVKLGADAAFGNAAVVPGELTQEIFSSIISGEYKPSRLFEKDGIVKVSMEDMESGDYNFVFISYDADNQAQDFGIIKFKYTAGGATKETWTKLYTGSYTYSLVFTADAEGTPYVDEGLELYQSETDATKFKITPWGYGVDFIFHMDGEGNVLVDDQETGYSKDGYTIYVEDLVTAAGGKKDYGYSTYNQETGTFKFALCYYDNNNEIVEGGTGYETYVLDEEVKARVNRQLRAMKNKKVLAAAAKKTHKLHKDGSKLNVLTLPKIKFTK